MRPIFLFLATLLAAVHFTRAAPVTGSFSVVVHRSNPVGNLRLDALRSCFTGATPQWPNGSRVVLVERDAASPVFQFLLEHLVGMSPREYKRGLATLEYRGESPVTLKILNSDQAACRFVFNVPGSIALIDTNSLTAPECSEVQILRIDGKLPSESGYRLK
jgi:hypothetical protein